MNPKSFDTMSKLLVVLTESKKSDWLIVLLASVLLTLHFNYHPCWCLCDNQSVGSSVPVVSRWLWPGNRTFLEVASMMVTWWIMAFSRSAACWNELFLGSSCHAACNISIVSISGVSLYSCCCSHSRGHSWLLLETWYKWFPHKVFPLRLFPSNS